MKGLFSNTLQDPNYIKILIPGKKNILGRGTDFNEKQRFLLPGQSSFFKPTLKCLPLRELMYL